MSPNEPSPPLAPLMALAAIGIASFYTAGFFSGIVPTLWYLLPLLMLAFGAVFVAVRIGVYEWFVARGGSFFKYLVVGFANTGVDFLVFNTLMSMTATTGGIGIVIINLLSLTAGTAHSYAWMGSFAFRSTLPYSRRDFVTFWLVTCAGGAFASILVLLGSHMLNTFESATPLMLNFVKALAQLLWIGSNYLSYRHLIYTS